MATGTARRLDAAAAWPQPGNPDRAAVGLQKWSDAAQSLRPGPDREFAQHLPTSPAGAAMLGCICGASPFLESCAIADQAFVRALWERGPDRCVNETVAGLRALPVDCPEPEIGIALRHARRRVALAVGLADIAGIWSLRAVTSALSEFARTACAVALRTQLVRLASAGALSCKVEADTEDSGLIVIGMGKLGGNELNYSSDIDLILLYDPDIAPLTDRHAASTHFTRLARWFVDLLSAPTTDGRVFPVDLRLRPDPVSMPLVISTRAALQYYAKRGQTWERAALIKARPVAGDFSAGQRFLEQLETFVWRDNLDFATVQELHETKRRINAQHRGGQIGETGQNLKLGRGGIREIEFFAQAHQLAWGGTDHSLRTVGTCEALAALAAANRIPQAARDKLSASYEYLRRVEHRIQMIGDRQTHSLPRRQADYESLARFLGYANGQEFRTTLVGHLRDVEDQYESFFELPHEMTAASTSAALSAGNRAESTQRLARMGYRDPGAAFSVVERWRSASHPVARDPRAMELFQSLIPSLVIAPCGTENPDLALQRLDGLLGRFPNPHGMFTLFQANLHVLESVAETMVGAPAIGALLTAMPSLLESLLDPDSDTAVLDRSLLRKRLSSMLEGTTGFADKMLEVAKWTQSARFRVGSQILFHALDPLDASGLFSDIADCAIQAAVQHASEELALAGSSPGAADVVILATGDYGNRDMTLGAGVEMVVDEIDREPVPGTTDAVAAGPAQQLESLVLDGLRGGASWPEIYTCDVGSQPGDYADMQSRLDAISWSGTVPAWPRLVCCVGNGADRAAQLLSSALAVQRDAEALRERAAATLERLHNPAPNHRAPRAAQLPEGLAELAVLTHYLRLRHACEHSAVRSAVGVAEVLAALGESDAIPHDRAMRLVGAWRLLTRIRSLQGLLGGSSRQRDVPARLRPSFAEAAEVDDYGAVAGRLHNAAAAVQEALHDCLAAG